MTQTLSTLGSDTPDASALPAPADRRCIVIPAGYHHPRRGTTASWGGAGHRRRPSHKSGTRNRPQDAGL